MKAAFLAPSLLVIFLFAESSCAFAQAAKDAPKDPKGLEQQTRPPATGLEPGSQVICESDIFFSWAPEHSLQATENSDAAAPDDSSAEPIKDFYITIGEDGLVEEEVKNRLETKIPQIKQEALDFCTNQHQDQTNCVTVKLKASAEKYSRLDYIGRRTMIEAINTDCEHHIGRCLSSAATDVKCRNDRLPDLPVQPPPGVADAATGKGGKDAKKK